jgi:methyl-accepting chemotaxis protein
MTVAWKDRFTTRISLFSGAFALIAAALLGYTIYTTITQLTEQQILNRLSSAAESAGDQITLLGTAYEKDLWLLASQPETIDGFDRLLENIEMLEHEGEAEQVLGAAAMVGEHEDHSAHAAAMASASSSEAGEVLAEVHVDLATWFEQSAMEYGFHNFLFVRPDGLVFHSATHQEFTGLNVFETPEVYPELTALVTSMRDTSDTHRLQSSDFFEDIDLEHNADNAGMSKFLGVVIENDDGSAKGFLIAQIEASEIVDILARDIGLDTNVQTFIVQPDHSIVLSSNLVEEDLLAGFVEDHAEEKVDAAISSGASDIGIAYEEDGEKYIEAYTPVTFVDRTYVLGFDMDYDIVPATAFGVIRTPVILLIGLASLFIVIFVTMMRRFTGPLQEMQQGFQKVARDKDFSIRIPFRRNDEVGASIASVNMLLEKVDEFLHETHMEAAQLLHIATEMRSEADDLASNTESQTASIEELSSSLEETSEQISATNQRVSDTREITDMGKQITHDGQQRAERMAETMNEVDKASADIEKIIGVINGIAFQTNILSLNASVDAARAGKEGKGFAAVAVEVGNLAKRSAEAARESEQLIGKTRETIVKGVEASRATREHFLRISEDVNKTAGYIGEIEEAARNQTTGLRMIGTTTSHLSETALRNSHRSERLVDVAREMEHVGHRFLVNLKSFKYTERSAAKGAQQQPDVAYLDSDQKLAAE